ncbi:MAG: RHS repeat-associated core domain-containing protein [Polyangiaceae bacterium]|nr:RHS repeat-associated core domain-containing protein [Polyangiaceae bacterium]
MIATERASEITKSPARSRRGERVAARKRGSAATRSSPRDRVRRDRGEAPNALREKWRAYGGRTVEPTNSDYGEVETYTATVGGVVQIAWSYVRDDLGRIVEKTETTPEGTRVLVYEYDLAARLSAVYEDGLLAESYGYDDNGNRLSSLNADGVFDAAFDEQDRLLEYGDESFTWTDNGELLARTDTASGDTTTFAYDAMGNLRGVGLPNGGLVEYLVDGRGRRVGKRVNGALVKGWLWRGQLQPVAELDGAGNVVARFVYAGGINVPALMMTPSATYRLVTDHLGSVRRVLDVATGAVVQELEYDSWGRVLLDTNPGLQPFGFAGGLYDPDTGLVRFGARDYDAETGRWTAKDPIRFDGGDNLYAYVGNSPTHWKDPRGLCDSSEGGCSAGDGTGGQHGGGPGTDPSVDPAYDPETEMCFDEANTCDDLGGGGWFLDRVATWLAGFAGATFGCSPPPEKECPPRTRSEMLPGDNRKSCEEHGEQCLNSTRTQAGTACCSEQRSACEDCRPFNVKECVGK